MSGLTEGADFFIHFVDEVRRSQIEMRSCACVDLHVMCFLWMAYDNDNEP